MTPDAAWDILTEAEALHGGLMLHVPPDEPGCGGWVYWVPGLDEACLGGYWYTADQLEAIAVWMRMHGHTASAADGSVSA